MRKLSKNYRSSVLPHPLYSGNMKPPSILFKDVFTFSEIAFFSKTSGEDCFYVYAHWSSGRVLTTDDCETELARAVVTSIEHRFKEQRRRRAVGLAVFFRSTTCLLGSVQTAAGFNKLIKHSDTIMDCRVVRRKPKTHVFRSYPDIIV